MLWASKVSDSVSVVALYADGVGEIVLCTSHEVVFCVKLLVFCTSAELTDCIWFTFAESSLTLSSMTCMLVLSSCKMTRTSRCMNRSGKSSDLEKFTYKLAVRIRKLGQTR